MPLVTHAACLEDGYTVEYINGISDTKLQADENRAALQEKLPQRLHGQNITVKLAYNPSHLAGVGDVVQAISQMLFEPISDYDLHTVLQQMAVDDTTRKLLLVGHSQGALYANSIYDYLTANGEPPRSVDVYGVATPASYVAGGGKYTTSAEDAVIYSMRLLAQKVGSPAPLPANVSIAGSLAISDLLNTHLFVTYLDGAGGKIITDIDGQLDELQGQPASENSGCFTPPTESATDRLQQVAFAIADPAADSIKTTIEGTYQVTVAAVSAAAAVAQASYVAVASAAQFVSSPKVNPAAPQNQEKNFAIMKKLYGSSIDQETYDELNNQGGAAITALISDTEQPVSKPAPAPAVATSTPPIHTTPVLIAVATSTHATSTGSILPLFIGGGSALPSSLPAIVVGEDSHNGTTTDDDASTTPPVASTTPPLSPPTIFTASTTPPVLTVTECRNSLNADVCLVATTTVNLSWTAVVNAAQYGIEINGIQTSTTTATNSLLALEDQATSSISVVAYDMQNDVATSSTQLVAVEVPLPPVPRQISSIHDSFDTFNSLGWQTFGGSVKNFEFDDGADGECFRNGCAVGFTNDPDTSLIPRMYIEEPPALEEGAFSVYIKSTAGSYFAPFPVISLCKVNSGCVGDSRIDFANAAPPDNLWHQYYFAWRQGGSDVQQCIMQDDIRASDCVWTDTPVSLGTTFDGVALWSSSGYHAEFGANLWFDELQAQ